MYTDLLKSYNDSAFIDIAFINIAMFLNIFRWICHYNCLITHLASPVDHKLTCTVGLSTIEMFWMFILVSVSRAMTWSMWVMSQASRSLLPAGTSPRSLWNSCSFSASLGRPQASSKRRTSSFPSRLSGSSRMYCFIRLATVWGSYSSRHGHSSRSYAAFSSSTFDFIPTGKTWGKSQKLQGTFDSDFSMQTKENLARGMSWLSVQIYMKLEHFRDRPTVHIIIWLLN